MSQPLPARSLCKAGRAGLVGWLILLCATVAGATEVQPQALVAQGQRIYREGIGVNGQPLQALAAAQTPLGGAQVACTACHRRSGFGTSEGPYGIRPITAGALFEEQSVVIRSPRIKAQLGARQRPAYTEALLARAIRTGTDSAGEQLNPVMPRYAMADDDIKALSAYLATLSAQASPGVDDEEIHFATVVQPGVSAQKKQLMLDVMNAFTRDKAGGSRSDEQRRDAGTMRMYRAYRKWVLHVWELSGPSDTWRAQLDANYRAQPVFAMVGGLGPLGWQPIHEFAEAMELPSLFPLVDLPATSGPNHYNFYLSRGLTLEAQVLARFMQDHKQTGQVHQVYRRDSPAGATAAAALRQALSPGVQLDDVVLDETPAAGPDRALGGDGAAWVLWLDAKDLSALSLPPSTAPVYLSHAMLGHQLPTQANLPRTGVRLMYPSDLPLRQASRLLRSKIWMRSKNLPLIDEDLQINTLFAMTVLSDAVGHIMDSFSREYLVERVEHAVAQTASPTSFPSVSLGPGQRVAAKAGQIVGVELGDRPTVTSLSGWIVP